MKMKYNLDEKHVFICSNCGHEFLYKLPKILVEQMQGVAIQTIRKECPHCNQYVDATRKS